MIIADVLGTYTSHKSIYSAIISGGLTLESGRRQFLVLRIYPRALGMLGKHSPLSYVPNPGGTFLITDLRSLLLLL